MSTTKAKPRKPIAKSKAIASKAPAKPSNLPVVELGATDLLTRNKAQVRAIEIPFFKDGEEVMGRLHYLMLSTSVVLKYVTKAKSKEGGEKADGGKNIEDMVAVLTDSLADENGAQLLTQEQVQSMPLSMITTIFSAIVADMGNFGKNLGNG